MHLKNFTVFQTTKKKKKSDIKDFKNKIRKKKLFCYFKNILCVLTGLNLIFFNLQAKKIAYGFTGCTTSNQCTEDTNMSCVGNTCTCPYPEFWNGTYCCTVFFIRKIEKF